MWAGVVASEGRLVAGLAVAVSDRLERFESVDDESQGVERVSEEFLVVASLRGTGQGCPPQSR